MSEVEEAKVKLKGFTLRLSFAKGRVETIQGTVTLEISVSLAELQFEVQLMQQVKKVDQYLFVFSFILQVWS